MDTSLKRVQLTSKADCNDLYLNSSVPVLIEGFVNTWPAFGKWTPEFLASGCWGKREVPIATISDGDYVRGEINNMPLRKYLRLVETMEGSTEGKLISNTAEHTKLTHYLAQVSLAKYFPELLEDVALPPFFPNETAGSTALYVGGTLFSQLHYHPYGSATLSVLFGSKRVRLFAPDQGHYLYPNSWFSSLPHISKTHHKDPDPTKYPKFAQAESIVVTVLPGEMLFIPIYWWHSIENIGVSISTTSFWSRNWKSRFLPPPGARGPYLLEPASKLLGTCIKAIRAAGRALPLAK